MKILKIAFKNINSLKGQHEIDFREAPFDNNALFAITGPTGSGKSTLLDVITLALYQRIPRNDKSITRSEIEQKGIILTRGQEDAFASVTYACAAGHFTSKWSISTARTGNLRDYDMEISILESGEIITEKKSEVPTRNEELIGLNYDQFIKSVMLAQGDFARFLQVSKKERSGLLEKITGWDVYRKIGERVYSKYKSIQSEIDDIQKERDTWVKELLDEETLELYKSHKQKFKQQLDEIQQQQIEVSKQQEILNRLSKERKEKQELEGKLADHNSESEKFNATDGIALQQHNLVAHLAQELQDWHRITSDKNSTLIKKNNLQKELEDCKAKKSEVKEQVQSLIQAECDDDVLIEKLDTFKSKVENIVVQIESKKQDFIRSRNEANVLLRDLNMSVKSDLDKSEKELKELSDSSEAVINNIEKDFTPEELKNSEKVIQKCRDRIELLQQAKVDNLEIKSCEKQSTELQNQISEANSRLTTTPGQIKSKELEKKELTSKLEIAELTRENELLKASLEEHRKKLVDGSPCPLCGAVHHPYAEHLPVTEQQTDQIKVLKKSLEECIQEISKLKLQNDTDQKNREQWLKDSKELSEKLKQLKYDFERNYNFKSEKPFDTQVQENKNRIKKLEDYKEACKRLDITKETLPKIASLRDISIEGQQLRAEKKALFPHDTPVSKTTNALEEAWREISSKLNTIEARYQDIDNQCREYERKINELEDAFTEDADKHGFESVQCGFQALLPYDKQNQLEKTKAELEREADRLNTAMTNIRTRIKEIELECGDATAEALKEQQTELNAQRKQTQEKLENANRNLVNHNENLKKVEDLKQTINAIEKDAKYWKMLNKMIGSSTGDKFNEYAQELTLLQLLAMANNRLKSLSKRYLMANPTDDEDDSLTIIDKDMGGQRRSVKTLSGGETFIISLSLALALSDLASRNVRIDSLFIDEGFGTLDQEILDQTLDSLESLQQEGNKMIGIISHVDALKERICTQIHLKPNGQGYSDIAIDYG